MAANSTIPFLPDQNQQYSVSGLTGETEFITPAREARIVQYLDSREWSQVSPNAKTSRRVQQFGFEYSYSSKSVGKPIDPLEGDILEIATFLQNEGWLPQGQTQCIVNEYLRNQGISPHTDNPQFGPVVVTISLLENNVMIFSGSGMEVPIYLPRRGILVLEGAARYNFKHSISSTVSYVDPYGTKITKSKNYRRISLTFRTV